MRQIPVKNSEAAKVDNADFAYLSTFSWYLANGYATTTYHKKGASRKDSDRNVNLAMAREVARRAGILSKDKPFVDHINGNKLDNRRRNLRAVTVQQNNWNMAAHRSGTITGLRETASGTFQVRLGNKTYGNYGDRRIAELVYDRVAATIRGEFAIRLRPDEELPADYPIPGLTYQPGAAKKSGVKGVVWFKARQCWRVIVKTKTIGYFQTLDEAIKERANYED